MPVLPDRIKNKLLDEIADIYKWANSKSWFLALIGFTGFFCMLVPSTSPKYHDTEAIAYMWQMILFTCTVAVFTVFLRASAQRNKEKYLQDRKERID